MPPSGTSTIQLLEGGAQDAASTGKRTAPPYGAANAPFRSLGEACTAATPQMTAAAPPLYGSGPITTRTFGASRFMDRFLADGGKRQAPPPRPLQRRL